MITCPECSASNKADAQFCSECGAYLAWEAMFQLGPSAPPTHQVPASAGPLPETTVLASSSRDAAGAAPGSEPADATVIHQTAARSGSLAQTGPPQAATAAATPPTLARQPLAQPRLDIARESDSTYDSQARSKRMAAAAAMRKPVSRIGSSPETATQGTPLSDPAADRGGPQIAADRAAPESPTVLEQPAPDETLKPRLPGESKRHNVTTHPTAESPAVFEGGAPCRACGAGNDPRNTFCLRCGTSLIAPPTVTPSQTATKANPAPWYKRRFGYDRPDHGPAGSRPKTLAHQVRRRRSETIVISVLLTLALATVYSGRHWRDSLLGYRDQALDRVFGLKASVPSSAGPREIAGHKANMTYDNNAKTWWQAGEKKTLTYDFSDPFTLVGIIILPGAADEPPKTMARPKIIKIKITSDGKDLPPIDWSLVDESVKQEKKLEAANVTRVILKVSKTYPPARGKSGYVAINEVTFAARKW